MPSSLVVKLLERVAVVEEKVHALVEYQKWQLGLLALILGTVVASKFIGH